MALIPITEAAKLGLLPREFEEFFPGIARSSLFGSPLTLNLRQFRPGAGPLERGVGRFGFQHGVPGVAGVRFGLGPLLQGLGLSPGPSAVRAPGVVPGGRARAAGGGAASAETLAARGQPQDIEAIRRLLETGQLDPRALPPGLAAALMGGTPSTQASRAVPRPALTPRAPEPSGITEPLGQARQALTGASAAEQLVRAIQGGPPSAALPAETRPAMEAQRAGERAPFGAGVVPGGLSVEDTRILEGMLGPLSPGEVPTPEEAAQLAVLAREVAAGTIPGGVPAGRIPTDVTAGVEAGVVPTDGGGLALPSVGQTIGGLLAALQLAQGGQQVAEGQTGPGALQLAQGGLQAARALDLLPAAAVGALPVANIALGGLALGLKDRRDPTHSFQIREAQERQGVLGGALAGLGSDEAIMANMVFPGAGMVLGPVVGALRNLGVFGQHRTRSQALKAELLEAGRIGDTLRGPIAGLEGATDLESFFGQLQGTHIGYKEAPAEFVRRALTDPGSIMAASSPGGSWGDVSAMGVRAGLLGPSVQATVSSAIRNVQRLSEAPDALDQLARAEYAAQRRALQRGVDETFANYANITGESVSEDVLAERRAAAQATVGPQQIALDQRFQADPYSVLPPDFQALRPPQATETIPPSPAAPAPTPSGTVPLADQTVPVPGGIPPLPSLRHGGVVSRGGAYRLEAGEVVVPANGGRVIETRKDGNLYVPVDGGPPERAKKNPDPERYWRVVLSSQEAQDAIRSGDPAETPILANLGTMLMGPQKRGASLEFLRRAQHQNPAGTLMDALSVASLQEGSGFAPPMQRGLDPRFGPPERLFNPPAPLEGEFDREEEAPSGGGTGIVRFAQAQPSMDETIEQERQRKRGYLGVPPPQAPKGPSREDLEHIKLLKEMNVPLTPEQERKLRSK